MPRTVRASRLEQVDEIEIDLSAVVPMEVEAPELVHAVWLSAVIGRTVPPEKFAVFAEACGPHPTIYEAILVLNLQNSDWSFTLKRVGSWENVQLALMEGLPVLAGGTVYSSFIRAEYSGIVPMPKPGEDLLGGQMMSLISIDRKKDLVKAMGNRSEDVKTNRVFQYCGSHLRNLGIFRDFFVVVIRGKNA
jgi:hypothetical protein